MKHEQNTLFDIGIYFLAIAISRGITNVTMAELLGKNGPAEIPWVAEKREDPVFLAKRSRAGFREDARPLVC